MRWVVAVGLSACSFTGGGGDDDPVAPDAPRADAPRVEDMPPVATTALARVITIPRQTVGADLHDFPVYLVVELPGATPTNDTLSFTDGPGNMQFPFEVVEWNAMTQTVTAWVRHPNVKRDTDTKIVARYGVRETPTVVSNPAAVFGANDFAAVWHLDAVGITTDDATGVNPGTPRNLVPATRTIGKLGQGVDFAGTSDYIEFTNPLVGNVPHTISAWVLAQNTADENELIIRLGGTASQEVRWMNLYWDLPDSVAAGYGSVTNDFSPTPPRDLRDTKFHLVHWVTEGMNRKNRLYVDGVLVVEAVVADPPATTAGLGYLGNGNGFGGDASGLDGILDEVRISTTPRSNHWIAAEFANQNDPAMFYDVGPVEADPP